MQQHVDDLIKQADVLRSQQDNPEGALPLYLEAAELLPKTDERYAICFQQAGVCRKMMRQFTQALAYLQVALTAAEAAWLISAICRDTADVYCKMGDLNRALDLLEEALEGLSETEEPEHYGITLSWIGRVERDKGFHGSALAKFECAHQILHGAGNRSFELYNLLDLADERCKCHRPMRGRKAARQAFGLARVHGSRTEAGRALLIMVLGHDAQPIIKAVAQRKGR